MPKKVFYQQIKRKYFEKCGTHIQAHTINNAEAWWNVEIIYVRTTYCKTLFRVFFLIFSIYSRQTGTFPHNYAIFCALMNWVEFSLLPQI